MISIINDKLNYQSVWKFNLGKHYTYTYMTHIPFFPFNQNRGLSKKKILSKINGAKITQ